MAGPDLRKDVATGFAQVNQRLTQVMQRLAQLEQRLNEMDQHLWQIRSLLGSLGVETPLAAPGVLPDE